MNMFFVLLFIAIISASDSKPEGHANDIFDALNDSKLDGIANDITGNIFDFTSGQGNILDGLGNSEDVPDGLTKLINIFNEKAGNVQKVAGTIDPNNLASEESQEKIQNVVNAFADAYDSMTDVNNAIADTTDELKNKWGLDTDRVLKLTDKLTEFDMLMGELADLKGTLKIEDESWTLMMDEVKKAFAQKCDQMNEWEDPINYMGCKVATINPTAKGDEFKNQLLDSMKWFSDPLKILSENNDKLTEKPRLEIETYMKDLDKLQKKLDGLKLEEGTDLGNNLKDIYNEFHGVTVKGTNALNDALADDLPADVKQKLLDVGFNYDELHNRKAEMSTLLTDGVSNVLKENVDHVTGFFGNDFNDEMIKNMKDEIKKAGTETISSFVECDNKNGKKTTMHLPISFMKCRLEKEDMKINKATFCENKDEIFNGFGQTQNFLDGPLEGISQVSDSMKGIVPKEAQDMLNSLNSSKDDMKKAFDKLGADCKNVGTDEFNKNFITFYKAYSGGMVGGTSVMKDVMNLIPEGSRGMLSSFTQMDFDAMANTDQDDIIKNMMDELNNYKADLGLTDEQINETKQYMVDSKDAFRTGEETTETPDSIRALGVAAISIAFLFL